MPRVQYDDPAFYIFAISILGVYAFPATYIVVRKLLKSTVFADVHTERRLLKGEEEKSKRLKAKMAKSLWTPCFTAQVVCLVIAWVLLFILLSSYSAGGDIKQFDPFEILELESGASAGDIRKAYRKLSLKFHPDKNPDDPEAADRFMLISKAHEALTDEEAKKNYELYGSPDGKQQMQVSIGLPSFFMDKGKHTSILIVYLIILVVMIPIAVGTYYASSKKYGDNDIMKATYDKILTLFKPEEQLDVKTLTEVVGAAEEFAELKYKAADVKQLEKLSRRWEKSGSEGRKVAAKPRVFNLALVEKLKKRGRNGESLHALKCFHNNVALTAYLMRCELTETNLVNAQAIVGGAAPLIEAMIKMSFMGGMQRPTSNSWNVVNDLIHFQQRIHQCLWDTGDKTKIMYLQLPHFTEDNVKHIVMKSRRGRPNVEPGFEEYGRLQEFIRQAPEERRGLKDLTDEQQKDVHDVAAILPNWDVDVEIYVEEEDIIPASSIVTLKLEVTRNEVPEGKTATEIFAPRFPDGKYEGIWFLMGELIPHGRKKMSTRLQSVRKVSSRARVVEGTMQFKAPPQPGQYSMLVAAKSDSYFGCDFQKLITFTVRPADDPELTVYERHEEDLELLREIHSEVMGGAVSGSDSDSDSDDDDAPESKTADKRVDNDGDDDEESSSEDESESSDEE